MNQKSVMYRLMDDFALKKNRARTQEQVVCIGTKSTYPKDFQEIVKLTVQEK